MRNTKYLFILLMVGMFLASCVPQKKILYLQDIPKEDDSTTVFDNSRNLDYKIQPGDNLYIKINSLDEESKTYYNELSGSSSQVTAANLYLNSYLVNDTGYYNFPTLGYLYAKNKTAEEIQHEIEQEFQGILDDAVVIVRLASFRITLLGEFKNPGKYEVYQNNINIFEAVSMGGDLTDFARRQRVAIIRQTDKGSEIQRVNMNDKRILESDYYYLLPNDIVYAEPIKAKSFVGTAFPYGLLFTFISTALLIYTLATN